MADASIIVAIIALAASTVATVLASWSAYSIEKHRSIREAEKLLRKYQDPLLLAARDLQARLYNILRFGILRFSHGTENHRDALFIYTTFLVGQYFAWMHILQRQGQFIAFASGGKRLSRTHVFVRITDRITNLLNNELLHEEAGELMSEPSTARRWLAGRGRGAERGTAARGDDGRWTPGWWTGGQWTSRRRHAERRDIESEDTDPQDSEPRGPEIQDPGPQNLEPQNTETLNTARQDAEFQDTEPREAEPGNIGLQDAELEGAEPQDASIQDAAPQDVNMTQDVNIPQNPAPQDPFDPMQSFVLWKDRQRAIGEIMAASTDQTSGEPICMEYSEFRRRWKADDAALHTWFRGIPEGIQYLVDARYGVGSSRDGPGTTRSTLADPGGGGAVVLKVRLVCLQNLLVDLVDLLDEEGLLGAGGPSMERLRVADFLAS